MSRRRPTARALLAAGLLLPVGACARPRPPEALPPVVSGREETGLASWYGHPYDGRRTASGEVYDMSQMTVAHRTLPFGTWLLVENLANGRGVVVRVNDRGPFVGDRVLDLSHAAARVLDAVGPGVIRVRFRAVAPPEAATGGAGRSFSVQVGAFGDEQRARTLGLELERAGARVRVQPADVGGRTLYRVRVGGFPSRAEARAEAERLARAGHSVLLVEP